MNLAREIVDTDTWKSLCDRWPDMAQQLVSSLDAAIGRPPFPSSCSFESLALASALGELLKYARLQSRISLLRNVVAVTKTLPILACSLPIGSCDRKPDLVLFELLLSSLTAIAGIEQYPFHDLLPLSRELLPLSAVTLQMHVALGACDSDVTRFFLSGGQSLTPFLPPARQSHSDPVPCAKKSSSASTPQPVSQKGKGGAGTVKQPVMVPAKAALAVRASPEIVSLMCDAPLPVESRKLLFSTVDTPAKFLEVVKDHAALAAKIFHVHPQLIDDLTPTPAMIGRLLDEITCEYFVQCATANFNKCSELCDSSTSCHPGGDSSCKTKTNLESRHHVDPEQNWVRMWSSERLVRTLRSLVCFARDEPDSALGCIMLFGFLCNKCGGDQWKQLLCVDGICQSPRLPCGVEVLRCVITLACDYFESSKSNNTSGGSFKLTKTHGDVVDFVAHCLRRVVWNRRVLSALSEDLSLMRRLLSLCCAASIIQHSQPSAVRQTKAVPKEKRSSKEKKAEEPPYVLSARNEDAVLLLASIALQRFDSHSDDNNETQLRRWVLVTSIGSSSCARQFDVVPLAATALDKAPWGVLAADEASAKKFVAKCALVAAALDVVDERKVSVSNFLHLVLGKVDETLSCPPQSHAVLKTRLRDVFFSTAAKVLATPGRSKADVTAIASVWMSIRLDGISSEAAADAASLTTGQWEAVEAAVDCCFRSSRCDNDDVLASFYEEIRSVHDRAVAAVNAAAAQSNEEEKARVQERLVVMARRAAAAAALTEARAVQAARRAVYEKRQEAIEARASEQFSAAQRKQAQESALRAEQRQVSLKAAAEQVRQRNVEAKKKEKERAARVVAVTRSSAEVAARLRELKLPDSVVYSTVATLSTKIVDMSFDDVLEYVVSKGKRFAVPQDILEDADDEGAVELNQEIFEDFWGAVCRDVESASNVSAAPQLKQVVMLDSNTSMHRRLSFVLDIFNFDRAVDEKDDVVPTRIFHVLLSTDDAKNNGFVSVQSALAVCEECGLVTLASGLCSLTPLGHAYHAKFSRRDKSFSFFRDVNRERLFSVLRPENDAASSLCGDLRETKESGESDDDAGEDMPVVFTDELW